VSPTEPRQRIRNRLALAMASLVLATAAVAAVGAMVWSAETTEDELDEELAQEIFELVEGPLHGDAGTLSREIRRRTVAAEAMGRVYLYAEASARVIEGSWPRWPDELAEGEGPQTLEIGGARRFEVTRYVRLVGHALPDGRRVAVGRDVTERERLRRGLTWATAVSLGIALLLGIGGGLAVSRGLLGRVEAMNSTVVGILRSGRRERVPTRDEPDEFDVLATHFNQLLDENEALLERMREVTNEVAHDLRTPLSHMRTRIDSALASRPTQEASSGVLPALREDVDRILDTFNALLHIAQIETGRAREEMEPVDLTRVAADVCELYEPAAEEAGLRLEQQLAPDVHVTGHAHLLAHALTNLIENALKYAGGGVVTVSLEETGESVALAVADQGPGIPAGDRQRVLQRFARLSASRNRPGAGLGLALVDAVARLHEAELRLEDADPGLRVVLVLQRGGPSPPP